MRERKQKTKLEINIKKKDKKESNYWCIRTYSNNVLNSQEKENKRKAKNRYI